MSVLFKRIYRQHIGTTGTTRDTLAPYPWSRSVKTSVWLRALGNGDQRRPTGRKAREGFYVYVFIGTLIIG